MECFYPITGYQDQGGKVRPGTRQSNAGKKITIACGQCSGCKLERARQWSVRIMHEASMHQRNTWLTLTYDDDHLPSDRSLDKSHFQKFIRKWRKRLRHDAKIHNVKPEALRYYHCGEYGKPTPENNHIARPHYHACIFGTDFEFDQYLWRTKNGNKYYRSPTLESLWTHGSSEIGDLTTQSAGYTARYIMKKLNGEKGKLEYGIQFDHDTGEVQREPRIPPYTSMSLKPGIGSTWIQKYWREVYPLDQVIVNGHPARPPKYYDTHHEKRDPQGYRRLKAERETNGRSYSHDNTPARLRVKEEVLAAQTAPLIRDL